MLASCVQLGCFTWASTRRRSLCSISTAAWGVTSPLRQAYLHPVVPSQQRATVVLFDSMISITVAVETGAYARSS